MIFGRDSGLIHRIVVSYVFIGVEVCWKHRSHISHYAHRQRSRPGCRHFDPSDNRQWLVHRSLSRETLWDRTGALLCVSLQALLSQETHLKTQAILQHRSKTGQSACRSPMERRAKSSGRRRAFAAIAPPWSSGRTGNVCGCSARQAVVCLRNPLARLGARSDDRLAARYPSRSHNRTHRVVER